jgi:hypothetical protein
MRLCLGRVKKNHQQILYSAGAVAKFSCLCLYQLLVNRRGCRLVPGQAAWKRLSTPVTCKPEKGHMCSRVFDFFYRFNVLIKKYKILLTIA